MVVGENGVLNRATDATSKTANSQAREALSMAVSGMQGLYADKIADGSSKNQTFLQYLQSEEVDATKIQAQMNGYTVSKWDKTKTPIEVTITNSNGTWNFTVEASGNIGAIVKDA